jgi:hypothetical protein
LDFDDPWTLRMLERCLDVVRRSSRYQGEHQSARRALYHAHKPCRTTVDGIREPGRGNPLNQIRVLSEFKAIALANYEPPLLVSGIRPRVGIRIVYASLTGAARA